MAEQPSPEQAVRHLDSYFWGFTPTGVDAIDAILEAVCQAGKGYHSTEWWNDEDDDPTYIERIQAAADAAAKAILDG